MVSRCLSKAKTHIFGDSFLFVFSFFLFFCSLSNEKPKFTCCASLGFLRSSNRDIIFIVFPHSTPGVCARELTIEWKKVEKFINFHAVAFSCVVFHFTLLACQKTISSNFFIFILSCVIFCYETLAVFWFLLDELEIFYSTPETKTQQTLVEKSPR